MTSLAVGIDLGTTNSCVAVYINNEIKILLDENKKAVTPSFVYYDDDEITVGSEAQHHSAINPENGIFDSKRMLGHKFEDKEIQENLNQWPFTVTKGSKDEPQIEITTEENYMKIRPEEVSAEILKKMKTIASTALKQDIVNAVITVPAYFLDAQKQATKDAATIAGLNVLKLVSEPNAAALAFIHNQTDIKNRIILVYDLGGGTFDVSLMKFNVQNGIKHGDVLSVSGDAYLGGRDFDNNLLQYFLKEISKIYGTSIKKEEPSRYRRNVRRLRNKCEDLKKELSERETATLNLDAFDDADEIDLTITRKQFEEINDVLFQKTIEIVDKVVRKAKITKDEIDEVLLVGGSTRIPKIQQMVRDYFNGKTPNKTVNPEEAVARGAAIQAALLNDSPDQNLEKYIITDVTPFALGIEVLGKIFSEIIPENTKIPTFSEKGYQTSFDYQTEVSINVYEGESVDIHENTLLGNFLIEGIEARPRGQVKIDVKFEIDTNGILKVIATESSKSITKNLNIILNSNRLTDEQIAKIKARQSRFS